MLPDKNRNSKQKTPVAKRSVNPVWNYTFAYDDVSLNELSERALELTIWDHDRLASNEFLGGVRFSLGTGKSILFKSLYLHLLFCRHMFGIYLTVVRTIREYEYVDLALRFVNCSRLTIIRHERVRDRNHESFDFI